MSIEKILAEHTLHDDGEDWVCRMSSEVHPQRVLLCRWSYSYRAGNPDEAHRAHLADLIRDALTGDEAVEAVARAMYADQSPTGNHPTRQDRARAALVALVETIGGSRVE